MKIKRYLSPQHMRVDVEIIRNADRKDKRTCGFIGIEYGCYCNTQSLNQPASCADETRRYSGKSELLDLVIGK